MKIPPKVFRVKYRIRQLLVSLFSGVINVPERRLFSCKKTESTQLTYCTYMDFEPLVLCNSSDEADQECAVVRDCSSSHVDSKSGDSSVPCFVYILGAFFNILRARRLAQGEDSIVPRCSGINRALCQLQRIVDRILRVQLIITWDAHTDVAYRGLQLLVLVNSIDASCKGGQPSSTPEDLPG